MAMTPENYNGLENEYYSVMQMLSHDLDFNEFTEDSDDYVKVLSKDLSIVSSLKSSLERAYKNTKTRSISEKYKKYYDEMAVWENELVNRLKVL